MQASDDEFGLGSDDDEDLNDFANLKAKTNAKVTQRLKEPNDLGLLTTTKQSPQPALRFWKETL